MDISKIQFGLLSQSKGIEKSFEDLDVNNDGVINEQDAAAAAQNKALAAEITNLLSETDADENVEILGDFVDDTNAVNNSAETGVLNAADNVNSVTATDSVNEVNNVAPTTSTISTSNKKEVKSMEEYTEILDCKFNELYEKFCGNKDEIAQYVKNNVNEFLDITGDGRIDMIDYQIIENYRLGVNKSKKSISEAKGEDYFQGVNKFAQEVRRVLQATVNANDTNTYDLDDLENYFKLGGKNTGHILARIDKVKLAQTEDWESKLDTIIRSGQGAKNTPTERYLKRDMAKITEYINAHPENAQYASIAVAYQNAVSSYELAQTTDKERSENAQSAYNDYLNDTSGYNEYVSELKNNYPYASTPTKEEYAANMAYSGNSSFQYTSKQELYAKYINSINKTDLNGDGKFDVDDLNALCTDIDLDGDGSVSCEEKSFMLEVKSAMEAELYRTMKIKSSYNATNIDDVIKYFDNFDHDSMVQKEINDNNTSIDESAASQEELLEQSFGSVPDSYYKNGEFTYGRSGEYYTWSGSHNIDAARIGKVTYMDGTTASGTWESLGGQNITVSEAKTLTTEKITYGSVEYTFLHYVQSADLSKDELESILSKINGSSIETQYKLAEVKKVVETKLATME